MNQIRNIRLDRGLTQEELAEKVGVSRHAVIRWEGEQREPSASTLRAMSKALGCSVDALLGISPNPTAPAQEAKDF